MIDCTQSGFNADQALKVNGCLANPVPISPAGSGLDTVVKHAAFEAEETHDYAVYLRRVNSQ